ncbi:hypothetical protein ACH4YO_02005 [Streptomyces noursei]|uniref:hypothetical protein n=1 Tax=Streptomyces noursei TaxID=1971 RepID=UPI00081C7B01|nr:hypothetical protein [Streptomyces noursei]ANZ21418.1 membrane protein [Streptomyces noursei ATCC 11455]MCZ1020878.1 hypothetical protein [Streptomyces noursei]GGX44332.1 hypothetical protein GCM10010341_77630 [Streptomyces noursei]
MVVPPSSGTPSVGVRVQRHLAVRALVLALLLGLTGEVLLTVLVVLVGIGLLVLTTE